MRRLSKPLAASLIIVLIGVTVAGVASLQRQTMTAAAAAPALAQRPSDPPVPGSEIPADPAVLRALLNWLPSVGRIPPPARTGGRDTELMDCHSATVNLTLTYGWCFATPVRLFYNVADGTFLDPLTGQLFTYDQAQNKLFTAPRQDHVQQELEPPHLREMHTASMPNHRVTGTCTTGQNDPDDDQQQDVNAHVRNLGTNAVRSDSPPMRTLFREQAQWWANLCPGA